MAAAPNLAPRWQDELYDLLRANQVTQFAYVPDAGHRILIDRSLADPGAQSVALTTEEEGVALLAGAGLLVAALLATPYAFVYDMPIVATAVIWFVAERHRAGDALGTGEVIVLMLAMLAPITLAAVGPRFPLTLLSLILLLAAIVRRCRRLRSASARSGLLAAVRG